MDTVFVDASKLISNIFSCISRGIGFTIIVFLTAQYFIKHSRHNSAYFVILNAGYIMDFILFVNWVIPIDRSIYLFTLVTFEWYALYFSTIWNVVLCLNRCTALVFLVKYDKIWTRSRMFCIIIFMVVFPFAVDGYSLFTSNCSVTTFQDCLIFRKLYFFNGTIINAVLNAIAISLIAASMYISSKNKTTTVRAKAEHRLIYQAIFSSAFQLISFSLKFASASTTGNLFLFFMYFSNILWHFHHLAVMGSHFILSPSFKVAYFRFYRLHFLLPKQKQQAVTRNLNTNLHTVSLVTVM